MIPLMNLDRQYKSIEKELDEAALNVLHSGKYILGEAVESFEKNFAAYCGAKYAVGVGNGTDALVIALEAAGVGAGDEVITCAMSFFATAEAIGKVGATPVFADCTRDTYVLDADAIEEKITDKTKAIIPIHLYGQCADMDKINAIAAAHGLLVIEDCAQAAGASYKGRRAGSLGDVACFSFFPTKNLGCAGDGGIILTSNESIYKQCLALRVHGSGENGLFTRNTRRNIEGGEDISFGDNLPKYFNFVLGYNSRLDALQAALLDVKLPYLEGWNDTRRKIANEYNNRITSTKVVKPICDKDNTHIYYVYVLTVEDRDGFKAALKEKGVSTGVYFPIPLHLQMVFEDLGYKPGDMPNAEFLAEHGVAIPMFAELEESEIDSIIDAVNNF